MKFNFESTRRGKYESTEKKLQEDIKEEHKLSYPLGITQTDNILINVSEAIANGLASLPSLPKIKFLEWRIKSAEKKLNKIAEKDQAEAIKLNEKYKDLLMEAAKSGDETKVKAFEKDKLGMQEVEMENAA
ncbi:MAG: hypothetical protein WAV15_00955 [Minisyncoccia bacterium]